MAKESRGRIRDFRVTLIGIGSDAIALVNRYLFQQFLLSGHLHKQCVFIDCKEGSFSGLICGTSIEIGIDYKLSQRQVAEIDEMLSRTDLNCFVLDWSEADQARITGDIAEMAANKACECTAVIFLANKFASLDETEVARIKKLAQKIERVLIVEEGIDSAESMVADRACRYAVQVLLYFLAPDGPFLITKAKKGICLVNLVGNEKMVSILTEILGQNTLKEINQKGLTDTYLELFIDHKTRVRTLARIIKKLRQNFPGDFTLDLNFINMAGKVILFISLES